MQGVLVKDYRIINAIGIGGMATVYLAEHQLLGNKVAVKILNEEFVRNKNIRSRFIAEAKNMARMSHPNIIKVTDLIDDGDMVAFVMEYIEGETLKEYLDIKGRLSDDELKKMFVQMLDAVGYVHEQGLVHRDIKPSNFMISAKGIVKLLDFGIAKNTDINSAEYTITDTTQRMGTPMYMSPEQIKSTKEVTHQTDIYSLGVVLWQIVMGKKPYDTNTTSSFELQTKIVNDPLSKTSTIWDDLIEKATKKDCYDRFLSCQDFYNSFQIESKKDFFVDDDDTIVSSSTISEITVIENIDINSNKSNEQCAINKIILFLKSDEEDYDIITSELKDLFPNTVEFWKNFDIFYPINSQKRSNFFIDNKIKIQFLHEIVNFIYEENLIKKGLKFIPLSYKIVLHKMNL